MTALPNNIIYAFSVYCVTDSVLHNLFNLQNDPMRMIYSTFYRMRHREFKWLFHTQKRIHSGSSQSLGSRPASWALPGRVIMQIIRPYFRQLSEKLSGQGLGNMCLTGDFDPCYSLRTNDLEHRFYRWAAWVLMRRFSVMSCVTSSHWFLKASVYNVSDSNIFCLMRLSKALNQTSGS